MFWSRRRRSVAKRNQAARLYGVSTRDLSEARGLVLFRVIRGGIEISQRLATQGTVYRRLSYSPSNPRGVEASLRALPITDANTVQSVIEKFREKYGAKQHDENPLKIRRVFEPKTMHKVS
jgi:hypothetical protein